MMSMALCLPPISLLLAAMVMILCVQYAQCLSEPAKSMYSVCNDY